MKLHVSGRYSVWEVDDRGGREFRFSKENAIMRDAVRVAAQCIGLGDPRYKINAMYLEYVNTAGSASVPTFSIDDGGSYYRSLSGTQDYLRVPLASTPLLSASNAALFSGVGVDCDLIRFSSQSFGSTGVNGLAFSAGDNSLVIGVALVAAPVWADPTRDLVFARGYFDVSNQVRKTASKQISVSWEQNFNIF